VEIYFKEFYKFNVNLQHHLNIYKLIN
jgi:hypothetical protein